MQTQKEILNKIKSQVLAVVPDANVYLFGSRARGDYNSESDWDILVKTKDKPDYRLKDKIRNSVFAVTLDTSDFINTVIVSDSDWDNSPEYYVLHKTAQNELIQL
jgi:uncharacterized protein